MAPDVETLIVGAGFSGIGAAIALDRAGLGDYRIIEAGESVGGTWYWNTYPGIAVDIPSFSYQFSFEQNPQWSRTYAPGHELRAYAEHCADKYGLRRKIGSTPGCSAATFDDDADVWRVDLDSGETVSRPVPDQRQRRADHPEASRHRRRGVLRRGDDAHRALGSQPGPDR